MTRQQLGENIGVALDSLRARPGRSFLTLLGIVIGVAAVITVAALIEGLNRDIVSRVQQLGSKVFFVGRFPAGVSPEQWTEEIRTRKDFEYSYARAIRESCPTVEYATVFADHSFVFGYENEIRYRNERATSFFLRGVDEQFDDAMPMATAEQGRFITEADQGRARPVTVIGLGIAEALFPQIDPLGRTVRLNGMPFEVIGVLANDDGLFGGPGLNDFVLIPYATFHKLYPEVEMHYLAVSVADTADLPQAVDEVVATLRRLRDVPPHKENDFEVTLPDFLENLWSQLTSTLFLLTFGVSSMALVVGGIGVMNVMLVSVTERTKEIGVRKAVGARRQDIRAQFLIEALAQTIVGGVLGIAVGAAASWAISQLFPTFSAYLSTFWIVTGAAVSAATGLIFGYKPASRAAEMDPIECLRYE
ncbi:MAG: FtsX-like permease family protein [Acidobacteria bacterium]|nr:FtsX-like permease family protein [Acidobacteriota bacterium]